MTIFAVLSVVLVNLFFQPSFAYNPGVLNFKQTVTDNDGKKYVIGEVQNNDPNNNIESTVYFGNSTAQSQYGKYIGIVGHGMAMPFKIKLPSDYQPDLSEMRVDSQVTLARPDEFLKVDYSTLHMDHNTHAITGTLRNTSTLGAYGITVFAIAEDAHAKVLDVVQSDFISKIPPNGSSTFTLVPIDSVSKYVSYYSCFVPGQSGQNYTLPAENNQTVTFELGSDGEIKNVHYDEISHSISFNVEGVFPQGGWAELMMISGPPSYDESQSLSVMLNGENTTKSISSTEILSGKEYKHVSLLFPFGKNVVSIQPTTPVPEYPLPTLILMMTFLFLMLFSRKTSLFKIKS